jgi:cytochrome c-type biogenesis protein CcmH/NrfG
MTSSGQYVKKQTMLIGIVIAFTVGFLGGIIYSVYNTPVTQADRQQTPDNNAAIASLEEEVANHPANNEAWTRLGDAYFDSDQAKKAIDAYRKSLELVPDNQNVLTDLGIMYRRDGQPDKAVATFEKVLQLNPRHEQAMFNRGVVLFYDLKNTRAAIRQWRDLLAVNPNAMTPSGTPLSELVDQAAK